MDSLARLILIYNQAGNWLLPLLRQRRELARLPVVSLGPCDVHFDLGGGHRLAYFGILPKRETLAQRAYRLMLAATLGPFGSTLTLQPDAAAGMDTYVNQSSADSNFGNSTALQVMGYGGYVQRFVVQFNLSDLPAGAIVSAATFTITDQATINYGAVVNIYRVLSANDWSESQSTWNVRKTSTAWAGSAGCSTAGTDRSSTLMGTFTAVQYETANLAHAVTLDLTEFGLMVANNRGLVGLTTTSNIGATPFYSSDIATASYRPKLVVEYTVPTGRSSVVTIG